jgi:hypothetical protein
LRLSGGRAVFSVKPPITGVPFRITVQSGGTLIVIPPQIAKTLITASVVSAASRRSSAQPPMIAVISPPRKSGALTRRSKPPRMAVMSTRFSALTPSLASTGRATRPPPSVRYRISPPTAIITRGQKVRQLMNT